MVGLTFDASAFDNSIISDNISHYAVWRYHDPTGESIASLDEGNWELLGTMPAQGFTGYAYQAEALGNTNAFGTFNSCYTVVAHTDTEDVYWYSNVMCGEAIDNLAPEDPELNGLVLNQAAPRSAGRRQPRMITRIPRSSMTTALRRKWATTLS